MEIRAYSYEYLRWAQRILADAIDFAVNTCGLSLSEFEKCFLNSKVVLQFQNGNCKYVAGVTGCELFRLIAEENEIKLPPRDDIMYTEKSVEYWTGWALAFYQWYRAMTFAEILAKVSLETIATNYNKYHEMDIMQFVDYMDSSCLEKREFSMLRRLRKYNKLSQSELAKKSGVSIRQIQLFEQHQRDINKTQAETLYRLSDALNCDMKDLLERETE